MGDHHSRVLLLSGESADLGVTIEQGISRAEDSTDQASAK